MSVREDQCIAEGQGYPNGCPHAPEFWVAGDPSCRHHLLRNVRQRMAEVKSDSITVEIYAGPVDEEDDG